MYRFALALAEVLYAYLGFEFKIIYAQAQILSQIPIMFSKKINPEVRSGNSSSLAA